MASSISMGPSTSPNGKPGSRQALESDRGQVQQFIKALFRYADEGTFVALRAFDDLHGNEKAAFVEGVEVDSPHLLDRVCARIAEAANAPQPLVFCPPVATFKTPYGAKADDLANG